MASRAVVDVGPPIGAGPGTTPGRGEGDRRSPPDPASVPARRPAGAVRPNPAAEVVGAPRPPVPTRPEAHPSRATRSPGTASTMRPSTTSASAMDSPLGPEGSPWCRAIRYIRRNAHRIARWCRSCLGGHPRHGGLGVRKGGRDPIPGDGDHPGNRVGPRHAARSWATVARHPSGRRSPGAGRRRRSPVVGTAHQPGSAESPVGAVGGASSRGVHAVDRARRRHARQRAR